MRPCHSSPVALVFGLVVCARTAGAQQGANTCGADTTQVIQTCCGGINAQGCFMAAMNLPVTCGLPGCLSSLRTADASCQDGASAAATTYNGVRQVLRCSTLDNCDRSYSSALATCGLTNAAQLTTAATALCSNTACVQQLQAQVRTCSNAVNPVTRSFVQALPPILAACPGAPGAGGAAFGQPCSPAQLRPMQQACCGSASYPCDNPNCQACTPQVNQTMRICPISFMADSRFATMMAKCGASAGTQAGGSLTCPPNEITELHTACCGAASPWPCNVSTTACAACFAKTTAMGRNPACAQTILTDPATLQVAQSAQTCIGAPPPTTGACSDSSPVVQAVHTQCCAAGRWPCPTASCTGGQCLSSMQTLATQCILLAAQPQYQNVLTQCAAAAYAAQQAAGNVPANSQCASASFESSLAQVCCASTATWPCTNAVTCTKKRDGSPANPADPGACFRTASTLTITCGNVAADPDVQSAIRTCAAAVGAMVNSTRNSGTPASVNSLCGGTVPPSVNSAKSTCCGGHGWDAACSPPAAIAQACTQSLVLAVQVCPQFASLDPVYQTVFQRAATATAQALSQSCTSSARMSQATTSLASRCSSVPGNGKACYQPNCDSCGRALANLGSCNIPILLKLDSDTRSCLAPCQAYAFPPPPPPLPTRRRGAWQWWRW
eukprot:COSAG01_NODE_6734_length_3523_cov_37.853972_1_plen_669_part_00